MPQHALDSGAANVFLESRLQNRLAAASELFLFLDYDGTLVHFAPLPELAIMPGSVRELILVLSQLAGVNVAIVSGRSASNVAGMVGLDLIYAGNHGIEITGKGIEFQPRDGLDCRREIAALVPELHALCSPLQGVRIEDKSYGLALHYRNAAPGTAPQLLAIARAAVRHFPERLKVVENALVVEIRPVVEWNKGSAARWILDRIAPSALPVALGDDRTDEDMFTALTDGVTVHVGSRSDTSAPYRLADPDEVIRFLRLIHELRVSHSAAGPGQTPH